jgi:hypothetical protein
LVIKLPEANAIIVQDLLYNGVHFWPGTDRKNWLTVLENFRTLSGYETLLVGHGMPTSMGQIDPCDCVSALCERYRRDGKEGGRYQRRTCQTLSVSCW